MGAFPIKCWIFIWTKSYVKLLFLGRKTTQFRYEQFKLTIKLSRSVSICALTLLKLQFIRKKFHCIWICCFLSKLTWRKELLSVTFKCVWFIYDNVNSVNGMLSDILRTTYRNTNDIMNFVMRFHCVRFHT